MSDLISTYSQTAAIHGLEANIVEFYRLFRHWPSVDVYEQAGLLQTVTPYHEPLLNSVIPTQLDAADLDDIVLNTLNHAHARHVPLLWWVGLGSQPSNLESCLKRHRLWAYNAAPGMAIDLSRLGDELAPPIPAPLHFKSADSYQELQLWNDVLAIGYGMEADTADAMLELSINLRHIPNLPYYAYLAYWDDEPVATCALLLAGGVAGIYNVATVPHARRQGIGAAITYFALTMAQERGYSIGVLQSSCMAQAIYERLGFSTICHFKHFVRFGAAV